MKIIFVGVLLLVACSMTVNAYGYNQLNWLKHIVEENARTHCFDEYLKVAEKINSEFIRAMNKCAVDNKEGRQIVKCINQVTQKASIDMLEAEQLICAE